MSRRSASAAAPKLQAAEPARLLTRLASAVYEGLLVFGVLALAGLLYAALLRPPGNQDWGAGFALYLWGVMAVYFVLFWSRGETLAMATWHLRVVRRQASDAPHGEAPSRKQALGRFVLSWLWVAPGLLTLAATDLLHERRAWGLVMTCNVLAYAALTRLHPRRQYLHDALAGTEIVQAPRRPKQAG